MGALLSLSGIGREVGWGGRLFEAGRLLTFSAFRMGAYSRLGAYSNRYGICKKLLRQMNSRMGSCLNLLENLLCRVFYRE